MNALTGTGGVTRKSPVEIVATAASVVTHSPYAEVAGLSGGKLGRWTNGVAEMRSDRAEFAAYWDAHNERVLQARQRAVSQGDDPGRLWVALGDSTAQGLGAPGPNGGYVGQTLTQLRRSTGEHWRVINLSVSGALIRDVLADQLPLLQGQGQAQIQSQGQAQDHNEDVTPLLQPDLVTCGAGANDILYSAPAKLFGDMRALLASVPDGTVMLDLPLLSGFWGILGRISVPYITRINRVIREVAVDRSLRVAEVSKNFTPPWVGKFSVDNFHPSQDGYRDWTRALIEAV
jgi:acyl-CoA thioesterase I